MQTITLDDRFLVRVVQRGDQYGRDLCLTHDDADPLVEFYDTHHTGPRFGPFGQFVSRYYLRALLDHPVRAGLQLDGGVPAWSISPLGMAGLFVWLHETLTFEAEA
jgi:hypothetical protein